MLDPVNSGIRYNQIYTHYDAAVTAGLDLWRWENGDYPKWFMANVIAYYEGKTLISEHGEDAVARKLKAARKRG